MFKKLSNLYLSVTASFLFAVVAMTLNTTSMWNHGEPDCPEELLK